jgi:SAM-dependent methyltransferase
VTHQHASAAHNPSFFPTGEDGEAPAELFTAEFWDERYASADSIWSGNPNPQLVELVGTRTSGRALDVGCGEGADASWLASRGFEVTGVDVSVVALERAAERAQAADPESAARITWQPVDVLSWDPAPEQYDLVSAQFIHLPRADREALHRRLADAVRPGGQLIIVGHHPDDHDTALGRPHFPHLLFTGEEVAAGLDPHEWQIDVGRPAREVTAPDGQPVTIHDAVLNAIRR